MKYLDEKRKNGKVFDEQISERAEALTRGTVMSESENTNKPWGMDIKTYCMVLHLSQLAGYLVPFAGLVLPIVMWVTNRDQFAEVDRHGKNVLNWMLSALIYLIVSGILTIVVIGFLGFILVGLAGLIFAIIGAIKANDGTVWEYPLAIKFFKTNEPAV